MKRASRPRISRRQPPRWSFAFALMLAAVRLVVGIAAFQLSELGHFGADLAEATGLIVHQPDADDARESEPGHDCPPGCPKCHHVHPGNAALAAWLVPVAPRAVRPEGVVVKFPPVAERPPGPPPPSVFRPPRRTLALA